MGPILQDFEQRAPFVDGERRALERNVHRQHDEPIARHRLQVVLNKFQLIFGNSRFVRSLFPFFVLRSVVHDVIEHDEVDLPIREGVGRWSVDAFEVSSEWRSVLASTLMSWFPMTLYHGTPIWPIDSMSGSKSGRSFPTRSPSVIPNAACVPISSAMMSRLSRFNSSRSVDLGIREKDRSKRTRFLVGDRGENRFDRGAGRWVIHRGRRGLSVNPEVCGCSRSEKSHCRRPASTSLRV